MRVIIALATCALTCAARAELPTYGRELDGFDYPHPVQRHEFTSQGQALAMAFMDVAPERPNGRAVVLLHGKNFCAATWEGTIAALTSAGYRVLAPDQIGFCKSTKPEAYQFTFHQLAQNTRALLAARAIERPIIVGHSMGGMLAVRFALMYPAQIEQLVLVNPIGLEDWKAEGVPYQGIDAAFQNERKTSFESIKQYQRTVYYSGQWKPEYDRWVAMLAGMYAGPGGERVAWNQALTSDMVFTQPVVHEFERIKVPTLLLIGGRDRTAIGKNIAQPEVAQRLGNYPELGRRAARRIPGATLVEFPELGHSPQIEAPDRFHAALLKAIAR